MTMSQVRQVLLGTAQDVGAPGVDPVFGYGQLDVGKAVRGPGKFDWGDFVATVPSGRSTWENDITGNGGLVKAGDGALILTGNRVPVITVVMAQFVTEMGLHWNLMAATAVMALLPAFLIALFGQKYVIQGLRI